MKKWMFWLGIVISIVLMYFSLRKLNLVEAWQTVKNAKYLWLIPGIVVYFMAVWVRTWRWHYLLRPLKKISTASMFPVVAIGYMGNNIYPYRAGELLRAAILKRREGVPISASLATIIVERVFDGVVMLAFVFLNLGELVKANRLFRICREYQDSGTLWGYYFHRCIDHLPDGSHAAALHTKDRRLVARSNYPHKISP